MKFTDSHAYAGADVEQVFALITDPAFREEAALEAGATDVTIDVTDDGGRTTVTIIRSQPAELPDFIKKLTGDTVKLKQTEKWGEADAKGNRTAEMKVSVIGQPAEMLGTGVLSNAGTGTAFELDGEVKVTVPFLGRKIEPEIAKAIKKSLAGEVELGTKRL